ncbi:DUF1302 domain-containing protein [Salicola sp. Rm-C-2C1-2]|uniref:DUF1302 domain-containing protein n=1 Tax=Salicola sp. Rm-C-2C1-2 TaxID=3141321 RepID=UPI0032E49320
MTKTTRQWQQWAQMPLAAAVAAGFAGPASAFTFNVGDVDGAFDTNLTAAVGWRTESPDKELIGQGNLPGSNQGASTINYDDGNQNFDAGDTYSEIVRGTSELYLNRDFRGDYLSRVGGFVRGRYWYDFRVKDDDFTRDGLATISEDGKDNASGAELLDAYVWTDWYLGDMPVSVRYGNQVFNWGESTFIQGGINATNPVDVGAIRSPGSELKEALLPVEALFTSIGLTRSLTLKAYVQFDWEPTQIDDCGTFFSSNDFTADGCGPVYAFGTESEAGNQGLPTIDRESDKRPDGEDQFGVALQWYSPELGNTEFGLYHVRYHSRLPYISGRVAESRGGLPNYFVEYPDDIKLYGLSMNTNIPGGWSVGAEYSFRENMPLQWNAFELINGGRGQPFSELFQERIQSPGVGFSDLAGEEVKGFDRFKVSQAQTTFIKFFDRVLGASRLSFVGEVGMTYVHDLPSLSRFGRSGIWGVGDFTDKENASGNLTSCEAENINPSNCTNDGFVSDFAWGYQLSATLEYNNAIAGATLKPSLSWSHDVNGYSPEPGGAFNEGSKAVGLGLTAEYRNNYEAGIEYTNYFGGDYNAISDRDNLTASVSYSF